MITGCKLTLSRKVRERAKVKTHTREEIAQPARPTRALQTSTQNCGKPGHWAEDCWNPGGGAYDNSTNRNTGKGQSKHTGKGKGKHVDVVETEQPQPSETASTVSYPSQDPSVVGELVHFKRGPVDHGCDNQFRVIHKETSRCRALAS